MHAAKQAALIIASLPEREAAELLVRLPHDVVELIARFTPSVESSDRHQQDAVATALATSMGGSTVRQCSEQAAWQQATYRQVLAQFDPRRLAAIMRREAPQTVAALLQIMDMDRAAHLLAALPTHQQLAVLQRLASGCQVAPEILGELLVDLVATNTPAVADDKTGLDLLARMLLRLDHATEKSLLENLRQEQPQLVDRLLQIKLVLQDLQSMDDMDAVPRDELVDAVLRLHADPPTETQALLSGVPHAA